MKCDYCSSNPPKATIWEHPTGARLTLCFHGCQHFPEPFEATGLSDDWTRIDPWPKTREQPRLRHPRPPELQFKLQLQESP